MNTPDDNDRLRDGSLPDDAFDDAESFAPAPEPTGTGSGETDGGPPTPPPPLPWVPFPVDELPEPCRTLVNEGALALGCDPAYLAVPMLAALAGAIGNRRRLRIKRTWTEPSVIWAVIIGWSGTLKSPALDIVLQPLRDREARELERHAEDVKKWEREMQRWRDASKKDRGDPPERPVARRLIINDTTVEAMAVRLQENPPGLLLQRDELAGWLKSFDRYKDKGGGDLQQWLEVHRAGQIIVDRKGSGGNPSIILVKRAAVSIVGGVQPTILADALDEEQRQSGLAARLLVGKPPRVAKTWTEAEVDAAILLAYANLFDSLAALPFAQGGDEPNAPVELTFTPDAKAAWIEFYNRHAQRQNETSQGDLVAAFAKLEGYAARFALVIAVVRGVQTAARDVRVVDAAAMRAGIRISEWFCHETERVLRQIAEDDGERELRRVYELAVSRGSLTPRELMQARRTYRKNAKLAQKVLDILVERGWGRWEARGPGPRGGRPTRAFVPVAAGGSGSVTTGDEEGAA